MEIIDALELAKTNMADYSKYVAQGRAYPCILDGAKSSYKRAIYGIWKDGSSKIQKVAELTAYALPYHPHPTSVPGVIVQLGENGNKLKFFDTQGNWGDSSKNIQASADRYIGGKLSDITKELLCDSMEYCDYMVGEIDNKEPVALPALIPLCFINGQQGIPAGLPKLSIPCIDISDMFDYYIDILKHKKLDYVPNIIPRYNTELPIYSSSSDWDSVIKTGVGTIKTGPKMEWVDSSIVITGLPSSKNFESVYKILEKEILLDKLDVRDESGKDTRIVIEKVFKKQCDMDEIYDRLSKKLMSSESFNMAFFDENKIYVPCSFNRVVKANLEYVMRAQANRLNNELKDAKRKLDILLIIEKMKTGSIMNIFKKDFDEAVDYICKNYYCDSDIAKAVLGKPMSYLTKAHKKEIDDLNDLIKDLENSTSDIWSYMLKKYKLVKKDTLKEIENQRKAI